MVGYNEHSEGHQTYGTGDSYLRKEYAEDTLLRLFHFGSLQQIILILIPCYLILDKTAIVVNG